MDACGAIEYPDGKQREPGWLTWSTYILPSEITLMRIGYLINAVDIIQPMSGN
jgi:hypothetical protein